MIKFTVILLPRFVAVDSTKEMIGTFSPQAEPYTHEMPEETTPSGLFARGTYSARTKVPLSFINSYNACLIPDCYDLICTI